MNIQQHITRKACQLSSSIFGNKGCQDYFILGQEVIDLLDEAFEMKPTGKYEYHILDDTDRWLGYFNQDKARLFSRFLNKRFCCEITTEEILESHSIDMLGSLINRHTGRFFPEKCKYCVDKQS